MGIHVSWVGNQLQPNTDIMEMRKIFVKFLTTSNIIGKDVPSKYIIVSQKIPFYTAKSKESYEALLAEASSENPPTLYLGHFEKTGNQLKLKKWKAFTPDEWKELFQQNNGTNDSRYFLHIDTFNSWKSLNEHT